MFQKHHSVQVMYAEVQKKLNNDTRLAHSHVELRHISSRVTSMGCSFWTAVDETDKEVARVCTTWW